MSKEKSSIGRYKLSKRTETIIKAKSLTDADKQVEKDGDEEEQYKNHEVDMNLDAALDIICLKLSSCNIESEKPKEFTDEVVKNMVELLDKMRFYSAGNIKDEDMPKALEYAAENHKRRTELFGSLKAISWTEFTEIYRQHGLDIDGRVADMELNAQELDGWLDGAEFSAEHKIFIKPGRVYCEEDLVDKYISKRNFDQMSHCLVKLQKLDPKPTEHALMCALVVFSAGRCKILNPQLVEKCQAMTADRLQLEVKRQHADSSGRFSKIMDCLVDTRGVSDMVYDDYEEYFTNEIVREKMPAFEKLLPEKD
ncbi:hypothetical protein MAR_035349 [Mya arenaria]|uniref:NR LBD domain-containing protein n=1 Tax=Mya arenaria TaxID=6604 RepID=A0ABY7EJU5_MYAAR|nr:hypothetical protein MAR_035349 [Mya arenaria]